MLWLILINILINLNIYITVNITYITKKGFTVKFLILIDFLFQETYFEVQFLRIHELSYLAVQSLCIYKRQNL